MSFFNNSARNSVNDASLNERVSQIEKNFLGVYAEDNKEISKYELDLKLENLTHLENISNYSNEEIEDGLYYLYLASQLYKETNSFTSTIDLTLDALSIKALKKWIKEDSIYSFVTSGNTSEVLPHIINGYTEVIENRKEHFISEGLPFFIPPSISYLFCKYLIANEEQFKTVTDCVEMLLSPIVLYKAAIDIQNNDVDLNENILHMESFRTLSDDLFSIRFHNQSYKKSDSSPIRGMPGSVAYRIAMAYLYGSDLPMDKQKAKEWMSYGMTVGNPYCSLAYILYFLNVNLDSSIDLEKNISNIYTILLNNLGLVRFVKEKTNNGLVSFPLNFDGKDNFEETCLFNLLAFLTSLRYECDLENISFNLPSEFEDEFMIFLSDALAEYPNSARLKSAVALYIDMIEGFDYRAEEIKSVCKAAKVKLTEKKETPAVIQEFFSQGLKEEDIYTIKAYTITFNNYFGPIEGMPKKYQKIMSNYGYGAYTFVIGNLALSAHSDSLSLKIWEKAASQGSGFAMLNLSFGAYLRDKFDDAVFYAKSAINYGIVFGYYILYKVYLKSDTKLAYTYLRYAAEYLFPDAIREYRASKDIAEYKPLPFMEELEKLEDMAKYNPEASALMSYIYLSGILLPCNKEKSLQFHKNTVINGYSSFFGYYLAHHRAAFGGDEHQDNLFTSYKKSLELTRSFFYQEKQEDFNGAIATAQFNEVISALSKGKTDFEKEIYFNAYNGDFLEKLPKIKSQKKISPKDKPIYKTILDLKNTLIAGRYASLYIEDHYISQSDKCNNLISNLSNIDNYQSANLDIVKSFMFLRSMSCPPNYESFKQEILKGLLFGSNTAAIFSALDFSYICKDQSFKTVNKKAQRKTNKKTIKDDSFTSDFFISTVTQ